MKASKDLERILDFLKSAESQLVQAMAGQQEAEANKELAGYQYDCRQWYGFAVDDRVLDLEPIDISGGAIDD